MYFFVATFHGFVYKSWSMEWKPHYFDRTMSFLQKLVIKHRMV